MRSQDDQYLTQSRGNPMAEEGMKSSAELPLAGRGPAALLAVAAAVAVAFFLAEHNHDLPLKDLLDPDSANVELAASEGSLARRVGFGLLLLTGLGCLAADHCCATAPGQKSLRLRSFGHRSGRVVGAALVAYVGWSVASLAWSADIALTLRRVGVLLCFTAGAVGIGRRFTLRQLCVLGTAVAGSYLLVGLADEIREGFFQPGAADYRFTGHVHPNLQATFCAMICLGSLCLIDRPAGAARHGWSRRIALAACAATGFAFLLLTKSRTATFALLAGCAVIGAVRLSPRQRVALFLSAAWLASAAILAASFCGIDVPRAATDIVLIDRTEDAMSLTGRIPLWQHLFAVVGDRILVGFGYGSFWTPQQIRSASAVVGTGISHAHCAYIELILNLGVIGLAIYLVAIGAALRRSLAGASVDAGALFLASLLCFGLVHAMAEALFATSSFVPFIAACGMWHLAFAGADRPRRSDTLLEQIEEAPLGAGTFARRTPK